MPHHERERDGQRGCQTNCHLQIDEPHFIFHARNILTAGQADTMGCYPNEIPNKSIKVKR
jgi:hypothetical protein